MYQFDLSVSQDINNTNQLDIDPESRRWNGHLQIEGHDNQVAIGPGISTKETLTINVRGNHNKVVIDADVHFTDSSLIRIEGNHNTIHIGRFNSGFYRLLVSGNQSKFHIRESVTSLGLELRASETSEVDIGRDCSFEQDVIINASDIHGFYEQESGERRNSPAKLTIGNHVWLGRGVFIGSGVSIGGGSVVEAMSCLAAGSKMSANTLIAGHPAKQIAAGIAWTRQIYDALPDEHRINWRADKMNR